MSNGLRLRNFKECFVVATLCMESLCLSVRPSVCPCVRFCPDHISSTVQPFLIKLGIVVYYYEAECHGGEMVPYLQCQGHVKGLYKHNMIYFFNYICQTACPFATKLSFILQHHKPERSVEKKKYITAFKVTARIQNVND